MFRRALLLATSLCVVGSALALPASAQDAGTKFEDHLVLVENGQRGPANFTFLDKTSKKWKICALFPHLKDSYWVSFDYGIIAEAKRLGVAVTVLQAGGYEFLPKQINQFDDCLASKADAILVAPISKGGLNESFQKAKDAGVPVISFSNSVEKDSPVTSRIQVTSGVKGTLAAEWMKKHYGAEAHSIIAVPGPPGGGWAEDLFHTFEKGLAGSNLTVAGVRYGDTSVSAQLAVVQDSLQAYPDADVIWGTAPTIEAALAVLPGTDRKVELVGAYENVAMLKGLVAGEILAFPADYSVMQARAALNLAVKALEGEKVGPNYDVNPIMLDAETLKGLDLKSFLAPDDFRPEFSTE